MKFNLISNAASSNKLRPPDFFLSSSFPSLPFPSSIALSNGFNVVIDDDSGAGFPGAGRVGFGGRRATAGVAGAVLRGDVGAADPDLVLVHLRAGLRVEGGGTGRLVRLLQVDPEAVAMAAELRWRRGKGAACGRTFPRFLAAALSYVLRSPRTT